MEHYRRNSVKINQKRRRRAAHRGTFAEPSRTEPSRNSRAAGQERSRNSRGCMTPLRRVVTLRVTKVRRPFTGYERRETPSASSSPALDAAAPASRRLHAIPIRTSAVACGS